MRVQSFSFCNVHCSKLAGGNGHWVWTCTFFNCICVADARVAWRNEPLFRTQNFLSILLFQDLAIIPLLAILPLLSVYVDTGTDWQAFTIGVFAIGFVIFAGRYLLDPLLGVIARAGAHEAMIAAALLVVFGSAMLMQAVGLSMALGSFLAGVLLAESSYKHELEANIEPFRGVLLGLFFMAVGLSLDGWCFTG